MLMATGFHLMRGEMGHGPGAIRTGDRGGLRGLGTPVQGTIPEANP